MPIVDFLLPEFDQEMANTRKILSVLPNEDLTWKPHDKSMALNRLAGHVAEMAVWCVNALKVDTLDITPAPGANFEASIAKNREQIIEFFDENVAIARDLLANASDEYLQQTWQLVFRGNAVVSMPRYNVIRSMVLNHMIHHRAQLGVYLRLRNIAIPGSYGPSADEPRMMPASNSQS